MKRIAFSMLVLIMSAAALQGAEPTDKSPKNLNDFKPDSDRYFKREAVPQTEELVTNYAMNLIWFNTPHNMTFERGKLFTDVIMKYRPVCLISRWTIG